MKVRDLRGKLPLRYPAVPVEPVQYLPYYAARDPRWISEILIHYTASPASSRVEDIAAYQVGPTAQEAFYAIAYHGIVGEDGILNLCHDLAVVTWGCTGHNWQAAHLCYCGDREPNAEQLVGLKVGVEWVQAQLGRALPLYGHKERLSTSCPGPTWPAWKDAITPSP